jgi:S-adenosyl-L-methionine-dependent methyltransferase
LSPDYQLVQLAGGARTLFSAAYGEKLHPGLGPQAEAELLYVRQLRIAERLRAGAGEFVIWDVGLGGAANAVTTLRATRDSERPMRLVSFDNTVEPFEFAFQHAAALGYLEGYELPVRELLRTRRVEFLNGRQPVVWEFHLGDFPEWLERETFNIRHSTSNAERERPLTPAFFPSDGERVAGRPGEGRSAAPAPDAIFYDAFSPAKNPAMWTLAVFINLFRALDVARPCALTTYSRSTMLRATLLLAGFWVGVGHATGMKEETTVAANARELIAQPLDGRWLERARRSDSAAPLRGTGYVRAPLLAEDWEKLRGHPQFCSAA